MAGSILGTAITGLAAFQRSLETTSHNIANVNTEGYSRQRVDLATNREQLIGAGYIGKGVSVTNISRSYDQFITNQLRSSTSAFGDVDKYSQLASQVDNILADPTVSMAPAIQGFFGAVHDATDDPSSIPARQVLLSEAEVLTSHFDNMNSRFVQIREQLNEELVVMSDQISSLATTIADLNTSIAGEQGRPSGEQQPNDLLDKRDTALNQLAELVDISVVPSKSNMVNVFMGKGDVLVLDTTAHNVVTKESAFDPSTLEIGVETDSGNLSIATHQLAGGALAGILRFRDEILDPAQQQLGSVAVSIAMEFNNIHEKGFDLEGNGDGSNGKLFFKEIKIPVVNNAGNTGAMALSVSFDKNNIDKIDFSDYQVEMTGTGPNTYNITRMADNTSFSLTESAGFLVAGGSNNLPGISIEMTGGAANVGDTFFIRPTHSAASLIATNLTDPKEIALATNEAIDSAGNPYFINEPMPGDNRNGLAMAGLENKMGMLGGTLSFEGGYGLIVSEVGVLTRASNVATAAQETLFNNAKESWSNVSGVNLDEEAANLIKFQQSYQAAAQMISVSNALFDSLLGAVN